MPVNKRTVIRSAAVLAAASLSALAYAADPQPVPPQKPVDLTKKTLYAVGYAHLDTQWRWSYPQVVRQFLKDTLEKNPPLLDKYPHYVFNFTGSFRYKLMKEYYPAEFARMRGYVKAGRWFPGGSNVDETDQNVPSAESVVRQVLYGNQYFRKEFGVCGTDFCVPDCFGFPASLPDVLSHCGIDAFHTAKLRWGSAVGIPFNVGVWEGVGGEKVVAAFDPTAYDSKVTTDLSRDPAWIKRATGNAAKAGGVAADYRYYGTGDRGGAPDERSVANVEKSVNDDGPLRVISATTDQMFKDLTPAERAKLPTYTGDLLLTWHSAGSITSQAYMKRWNRKNELLADAAERASVAAHWIGSAPYPAAKLAQGWEYVLEGQMHDILPGDCLPVCYEYTWNDEVLASNAFAAVETDGVGGVAAAMDTAGDGVPLVVYNPLGAERTDTVEATVALPGGAAKDVTVTGPDGKAYPAQVIGTEGGATKILFIAHVPGTSFATFAVKPAGTYAIADDVGPGRPAPPLKVTANTVENAHYKVTVNAAGDVAQVFDKANNKTLLSAPMRLGFLHQNPAQFPAWNMDWEDRQKECQAYVGGPATIKVIEDGPVRVALEITREARGSKFTQRVQLTAGGDRVEFPTKIDWQGTECSLEAVMPLAVSAPTATYDTQVGVTVRGNNNPKKYEVPQQQWLDVTRPDNGYGVSVLNDSKYGSDKPDDGTVRLTLLYTPGVRGGYQDEGSQDFGRHEMTYALTGHNGDWRAGHTVDSAARLNQPLVAFQAMPHAGPLGKQFQLLSVSNPAVTVQAVKKAEDSNEVIVRLKETTNKPQSGVAVSFAGAVQSAREVNGQEQEIGHATVRDGKLVTDLKPFHLRAFAVKLAPPQQPAAAVASTPVALPFDQDVVSPVGQLTDGSFDSAGRTYPAEQFPAEVVGEGITFKLGPTGDGAKNAVACRGQTIPIPAGAKRVYVLAAADGDVTVPFKVGDKSEPVAVQDWGGYVGQWDNRLWKGKVSELTYGWSNRLDGLVPGYVKPATVAWHADHRHHPTAGNAIWEYCYLFKYGLDVPAGATSLTLPDNDKVRVFAVSTATAPHDGVTPAQPLSDTLADHAVDAGPRAVVVEQAAAKAGAEPVYADAVHVELQRPLYWTSGGLHYTTDGTEPTVESPRYEEPLFVSRTTTVKARQFAADGTGGPVMARTVTVNDTTPPKVVLAQALSAGQDVRVAFSEPVTKSSAEDVGHYAVEPANKPTAAQLQADGRTVVLTLAEAARPGTKLTVRGVQDVSAAGNAAAAVTVPVDVVRPVFQQATYAAADGPLAQRVAGLPVKATDPWTVNCLVKADRTPAGMVVLAGFGKCKDGDSGLGRYLCVFGGSLHYWSCNQDVGTEQPFEAGKWQMVTATWDGKTLTMYQDGRSIGSGELALADDEPTIRLAPPSPWGNRGGRFGGEVKDFAIWNVALPPRTVAGLWEARRHD